MGIYYDAVAGYGVSLNPDNLNLSQDVINEYEYYDELLESLDIEYTTSGNMYGDELDYWCLLSDLLSNPNSITEFNKYLSQFDFIKDKSLKWVCEIVIS